ncbi:helix-turn-helix domain-containing protein [Vibrio splendidus]|uniref:helix-turn-helix domain-containing protein n=1 Tax=Vibrio splendidus TaxID=29497 RepID=UPI0002EC3253|nr:hypothetical protein [Vibrio splendidus]
MNYHSIKECEKRWLSKAIPFPEDLAKEEYDDIIHAYDPTPHIEYSKTISSERKDGGWSAFERFLKLEGWSYRVVYAEIVDDDRKREFLAHVCKKHNLRAWTFPAHFRSFAGLNKAYTWMTSPKYHQKGTGDGVHPIIEFCTRNGIQPAFFQELDDEKMAELLKVIFERYAFTCAEECKRLVKYISDGELELLDNTGYRINLCGLASILENKDENKGRFQKALERAGLDFVSNFNGRTKLQVGGYEFVLDSLLELRVLQAMCYMGLPPSGQKYLVKQIAPDICESESDIDFYFESGDTTVFVDVVMVPLKELVVATKSSDAKLIGATGDIARSYKVSKRRKYTELRAIQKLRSHGQFYYFTFCNEDLKGSIQDVVARLQGLGTRVGNRLNKLCGKLDSSFYELKHLEFCNSAMSEDRLQELKAIMQLNATETSLGLKAPPGTILEECYPGIRRKLSRNNITYSELAHAAGLSPHSLSELKTFDEWIKLCIEYGVIDDVNKKQNRAFSNQPRLEKIPDTIGGKRFELVLTDFNRNVNPFPFDASDRRELLLMAGYKPLGGGLLFKNKEEMFDAFVAPSHPRSKELKKAFGRSPVHRLLQVQLFEYWGLKFNEDNPLTFRQAQKHVQSLMEV